MARLSCSNAPNGNERLRLDIILMTFWNNILMKIGCGCLVRIEKLRCRIHSRILVTRRMCVVKVELCLASAHAIHIYLFQFSPIVFRLVSETIFFCLRCSGANAVWYIFSKQLPTSRKRSHDRDRQNTINVCRSGMFNVHLIWNIIFHPREFSKTLKSKESIRRIWILRVGVFLRLPLNEFHFVAVNGVNINLLTGQPMRLSRRRSSFSAR